jgi:DisA bacterial checkpoint controller nucleotide-binding
MEVLYVQSPRLSRRFAAARRQLIVNLKNAASATVLQKTLYAFGSWYPKAAKKEGFAEFDLTIIECSLDTLAREIKYYRGKNGPFLRHPEIWPQIIREKAMGAVLFASLFHRVVVFIYQDGDISEAIEALTFDGYAYLKKHTELSDPELISRMAYRVDSGRSALPAMTRWSSGLDVRALPEKVPLFASKLLAGNFSGDDPVRSYYLHSWVLSACDDRFQRRYDVVRTLCLLTEYARRVIGDQLEGTPLMFQAAIVPDQWWKENEGNASIFLTVSDKYFRISMKQAAKLTRLLHFSNGFSTIFIFSEDGALKGLMDVGSEQQKTRLRLDQLREQIDGFVIATDASRQLLLHSRGKSIPLMFANGEWRLESSSTDPLGAMVRGLEKWSHAQIDRICGVVQRLSDDRVGGFLIFDADPARAAAELGAMPLRDEPGQHLRLPVDVETLSETTLTHILGLDGAQFFNLEGELCLVCQHLVLDREPGEPREGGTKHGTARRVARRFREAIVTAISHDGPITTYLAGERYKTNAKPQSY